jgi:hypothetical protein
MTIQTSLPGSGGVWGKVGIVLWTILLGFGLYGLFCSKEVPKVRFVVGYTLIFQFAFHMFYGEQSFLYSLHFIPLLIIPIALSTLTRARPFILYLVLGLILCALVNNGLAFLSLLSKPLFSS